ncbi:MAG TPA: tetratricopeptide repeat protein [Longimicrobiales bacterium]|nr:tetratricopeptide repeat protein [Longimicrobiales bacterium]
MAPGDDTARRELVEAVAKCRHVGDFEGIRTLVASQPATLLHDEPGLGFELAYALRRLGEVERALALARDLAEPCRGAGDPPLSMRRANLEAMALFDLGRVAEANELWKDVLAQALALDEHSMVAHAANNLGVVATLSDRSEEALAHHARALAAYERLGEARGIALTHQNLGIAYRERGLLREADEHFRAATRGARPGVDEDVIARAAEERAVLFLLRGDGALAEATAERARARMARVGDLAGVAECLRVIGLGRLVDGRRAEAREPMEEALRLAREVGSALLEAETLEAIAVLEPERADALRSEAEALFSRLGAPAWGASVRRRMAQLAQPAG